MEQRKKNRQMVIGIDGMPYRLFCKYMENGILGHCREIADTLYKKPICSVMPPVSSTAWASYATGSYPEEHGILGFTEMGAHGLYIPLVSDRQREAIWNKLSQDGRTVGVINVPLTYPPEPVNGVMISCFLSPSLSSAVRPKEYYEMLRKHEYMIDVDPPKDETDKGRFLDDLILALKARVKVCRQIAEEIPWDYLHLHIMETDRLFHFCWDEANMPGKGKYGRRIADFFRELDESIAKLYQDFAADSGFTLISDHGFCKILNEIQVNAWLKQEGYYKEKEVFSLTPGRIYIRKEDRVKQMMKKELQQKLSDLKSPQGNRVIRTAYLSEDIYYRSNAANAPDLLLYPADGYDLKGGSPEDAVFTSSMLTGMHTYDNALLISTAEISSVTDITQVAGKLLKEINNG